MIKLLIFDYDGVIFDTEDMVYNLVMKECRKHCKIPIRTRKEFIELYKSNFYESMKKRGVSKKGMEKIKKESIGILSRKKLKAHKGIKKALDMLSKTHTLAVVSSNYDSVMKKNLKKNSMLENFSFILGTEEGESKLQKIKSLLRKKKASGAEAVLITDTTGDIKEAKKAGIKAMAVTWGFHTKRMLEKAKPDFIVGKPMQITEVLA
jgi:phosphoglycolate phosphatase